MTTTMLMGAELPLARCPHCGIAGPLMDLSSHTVTKGRANGVPRVWRTYTCSTCGGAVLAEGPAGAITPAANSSLPVERLFPEAKVAHEDLPEQARAYLDQAFGTMHAPDACAVMCGSAVDAMLKALGLVSGSVYERINQAVASNQLTKSMGEWAHEVRLGSNRPRHADDKHPHVSSEEAKQSVEFAEALGHFLFVLSARITKGIERAKKAAEDAKPS